MDKIHEAHLLWKTHQIGDAQMALIYFIVSHLEKYPQRSLKKYLEQTSITEIGVQALERFQFKKIKAKAQLCLKKWVLGQWSLVLLEKIPSAQEVLTYQARGIRPVTMKITDRSKPILHREDALDFFCHDLEHGHMFFFDDELKTSQIRFFQKMQKSIEEGVWSDYRCRPDFEQKFVYLISDMNSHPEHYKAYLNSLIEPDRVGDFDYLFD